MKTAREELLEKATDLGLEFPKNISTEKLEEKVVTAMEHVANPPEVDEPAKTDPPVEVNTTRNSRKLDQLELQRKVTAEAKRVALTTRVVTLTNKDNRENDVMTTAYLSFENQFFGLSKLVPLDIPVELEQGLIDVAESAMIPMHKDEIIRGKRTGNKVTVRVKKYVVSYGDTGK